MVTLRAHCKGTQHIRKALQKEPKDELQTEDWLEMKTGSFLKHQTEISQRNAELTKNFKRDSRDMKVVTDREMWSKAREGRVRVERSGGFRANLEKMEENESRTDLSLKSK